jgi:hypothetical protein
VSHYRYGYNENCHLVLILDILKIEQWKIIKQHRCKANEDNRGKQVCFLYIYILVFSFLLVD